MIERVGKVRKRESGRAGRENSITSSVGDMRVLGVRRWASAAFPLASMDWRSLDDV